MMILHWKMVDYFAIRGNARSAPEGCCRAAEITAGLYNDAGLGLQWRARYQHHNALHGSPAWDGASAMTDPGPSRTRWPRPRVC